MNMVAPPPLPRSLPVEPDLLSVRFPYLPWFAWVLPVLPALLVYANNIERISIETLAIVAAIFLITYVAFQFVMGLLIGKSEQTGVLIGTIFIGLFLSSYIMPDFWPVWAIGWVGMGIACFFKAELLSTIKLLISAITLGMLAFAALPIGLAPTLWERTEVQTIANKLVDGAPIPALSKTGKRDIYYLILDRYARADQLLQVYGYDNAPFLDALKARGFSIAERSYSNYHRTAHSLSSSLNMRLHSGASDPDFVSGDWQPIYDQIQTSRLVSFLKNRNYSFQFLGSWWEPTRTNKHADISINHRAWPELFRVIYENSVLGHVTSLIEWEQLDPRKLQCIRAKRKFQALANMGKSTNPKRFKFVFAHFLVPHPPFVLSAEGKCLSVEVVSNRTRERNYVEQLKFANSQILKFLDQVQGAPGPKPIIVVQADEGPWPEAFVKDEIRRLGADVDYVEWLQASPSQLREKMGILNAVWVPGDEPYLLSPDATPVNTFRRILALEFGAELPMIANRSYVYPNRDNIFQYRDVTERLARP